MNNRWKRIVAGIVMPSAIATVTFMVLLLVVRQPVGVAASDYYSGGAFVGLLIFAYAFAGIQSIIYSISIEFFVNLKIQSNLIFLIISSILGAISGFFVFGWLLAVIGIVAGFVTGLYVRKSYLSDLSANS